MFVLSLPSRLRASIVVLFLSIPLFFSQVVIFQPEFLVNPPWMRILYGGVGFFFVALPIAFWIRLGKRWSAFFLVFLGIVWVTASFWVSWRYESTPLAFFTLILLLWVLGEYFLLSIAFRRSYFNPNAKWYQGVPSPISGLSCRVFTGQDSFDFRVSSIDSHGVYAFRAPKKNQQTKKENLFLKLKQRKNIKLLLEFRNNEVLVPAQAITAHENGHSGGFGFLVMSADTRKKISDLLESLRISGQIS